MRKLGRRGGRRYIYGCISAWLQNTGLILHRIPSLSLSIYLSLSLVYSSYYGGGIDRVGVEYIFRGPFPKNASGKVGRENGGEKGERGGQRRVAYGL